MCWYTKQHGVSDGTSTQSTESNQFYLKHMEVMIVVNVYWFHHQYPQLHKTPLDSSTEILPLPFNVLR